MLSGNDDQANYYLDLVPVKDAGSYADAMCFLHELVPDDLLDAVTNEKPDDKEEEEVAVLAVNFNSFGISGRAVGDQIVLTRQMVPGSEEHGNMDVHENEFAELGIDHVRNGRARLISTKLWSTVVIVTGTNGATVFYDEQADRWFSY